MAGVIAALGLAALAFATPLLLSVPDEAHAQVNRLKKKKRQQQQVLPEPAPEPKPPAPSAAPAPPPEPPALERIEADVSTRTIAVTSGYSGAEILVFGSIENGRQPSAESGFYDAIVVVEGAPQPMVVRKKSRVAGLWLNTSSFGFNAVPSYYAVASTRPIEEFTDPLIRDEHGIGFEAVRMAAAAQSAVSVSSTELLDYKAAVTRLKTEQNLFIRDDYGVFFTGRSLFRCNIELPANVPVGPLTARIYLFHEGKLLSRFQARVTLEREGIERWLYAFAFERPFLYGIASVAFALLAGLVASAVFRRRAA